MSDHTDIPPNNDGGIDLETLVNALAENKEIGQPSEYYPSSGRVLEDSVDGTIYLGDGDQWLTVSTDSGLSTPAVDADDINIGGNNFAASGETFPLLSFDPLSNDSTSTTSTSWTSLGGATSSPFVDFSQLPEGTYEAYVVGQLKNDTSGEDTQLRLTVGGTSTTAATGTGTDYIVVVSGPATISPSGTSSVVPEAQVTGGVGTYRRLSAHIGMKL